MDGWRPRGPRDVRVRGSRAWGPPPVRSPRGRFPSSSALPGRFLARPAPPLGGGEKPFFLGARAPLLRSPGAPHHLDWVLRARLPAVLAPGGADRLADSGKDRLRFWFLRRDVGSHDWYTLPPRPLHPDGRDHRLRPAPPRFLRRAVLLPRADDAACLWDEGPGAGTGSGDGGGGRGGFPGGRGGRRWGRPQMWQKALVPALVAHHRGWKHGRHLRKLLAGPG